MNQDFRKSGPFSQIAEKINAIEKRLREIVAAPTGRYLENVRIYSTVAQTLTTGVAAALIFDSARWDTDACFDIATPTQLICRTPGKYSIKGALNFASNATGTRRVTILLNGTTTIAREQEGAFSAALSMTIATDWEMVVGDYVELLVFQNSGGDLDVTVNDAFSYEFMMHRFG